MDEKYIDEYINYLVKNKDKTFAERAGNALRKIIRMMEGRKENRCKTRQDMAGKPLGDILESMYNDTANG